MSMKSRAEDTDEQLIAAIAEGDQTALEALILRFGGRIETFVRRRLGGDAGVEEAVADTFFRVWRCAGQFRGESTASTWIHGVARNVSSQALRANRSRKRAMLVPVAPMDLDFASDGECPVRRLEARSRFRGVYAAMSRLPDTQREAIEVAFLDGQPYAAAGRRLGVGEEVVKQRVFRARARLRQVG